MTSFIHDTAIEEMPNPIDEVEVLAGINEWTFKRTEDELTMVIEGAYSDMQLQLHWREDYQTLQLANVLEIKIPAARQAEIYKTIALLNEHLWLGHFEYWLDAGQILFRHASLATDPLRSGLSEDHLATLIETAVQECERAYPIFQYILWGGMTPEDAVEAALMECQGSA